MKDCNDCVEKFNYCMECFKGKYFFKNFCVVNCFWEVNKIVSGVFDIKFVGFNFIIEGCVEFLYNGEWGIICDDSFDMNEVMVICW